MLTPQMSRPGYDGGWPDSENQIIIRSHHSEEFNRIDERDICRCPRHSTFVTDRVRAGRITNRAGGSYAPGFGAKSA
jgi:hypothetical protein